MAEELLITLGVQDKNATAQIRALAQQIKALDTQMKASISAGTGMSTSLSGLNSKLTHMKAKMEVMQTSLSTWKTRLSQANENIARQKALLQELTDTGQKNSTAYNRAASELSKYQAEANKAKNNIQLLETQMEGLNAELATTSNQLRNFSLLSLGQNAVTFGNNMQTTGTAIRDVGRGITSVGHTISALSVPFAIATAGAAAAAISYEDAFAGVTKTVDGTAQQMSALSDSIRDMALNMPTSANEIAAVAEAAGQLGIKTDDVAEFTEIMVMLGDTTNLGATEAATQLAKLANITGLSSENYGRLGASIVDCGNNFATTEADISNMALRLAGAGEQVGMSEADIIGLSTALSSVGITAEVGGSTFSKVISKMQVATDTGGQALEDFASVAGMSADEFKTKFSEDATGAIISFVEGLSQMDDEGVSAITTLQEMGISEVRLRDSLLRSANGVDIFKEAIATSNSAWEANTALTTEAEKRYKTTASQLKMFKNKVFDLGITLGEQLLPHIANFVEGAEKLVDWFANLDEGTQGWILKLGVALPIIGLCVTALGKFTTGIGNVLVGGGQLVTMFGKWAIGQASVSTGLGGIAAAGTSTASAFSILSAAALPVAGIIAGVGVAVYGVHEYSQLMNSTVERSYEDLSLLEKGFAALTGTTVYTKEELQDMNLIYKDFNENIGEEFRETVRSMTDDIHDFGISIDDFSLDGVFTEAEASQLTSRVSEALDNCISAIDNRNKTIQEGLVTAFNTDGVIDESETALLEYWNYRGSVEREEAIKLQNEINGIIQNARNEGRVLTPEEEAQIVAYYNQLRQLELEALADNSYEIEYATKEFQTRMDTLDAEGARKLLEQRHKQYEEQNVQTKTNYDTLIATMEAGYEEKDAHEQGLIRDSIERVKAARDAELELNKARYDDDVKYAEEHCQNLDMVWNKYRGHKIENDDRAKYLEYEQMRQHYANIESITESGYHRVLDTATNTWKDLYVSVDQTTGELKGVYDINTQEVMSMTKSDEAAIREEQADWARFEQSLLANCIAMGNGYADLSGNVRDQSGKIVGHIQKVKDANGNLKDGIVDLNGNPIDIGDNTDEVIRHLRNAAKAADDVDGKKATVTIQTNHIDNYIQKYNSQGPGNTMYEQGTHGNLGQTQTAYVNENVRGSRSWELVSGPYADLGRDSIGTKVLLGTGASVQSNVSSVAMMRAAVTDEVNAAVQNLINGAYFDYMTPNSKLSRMASSPTQVISPTVNNNFDDSNLASLLMSLIQTVQSQNVSPNVNVNLSAKSLAKATAPYIDKELEVRRKRR